MAVPQNLLQLLQTRTIVDCDTMELNIPKTLGPFSDCTSNQVIASYELIKPENSSLVQESIALSKTLTTEYPEISRAELAGEIAMVKLQLAISHYVTGYVHIQTNPYYSYETEKTVLNARRLIKLATLIDPKFPPSRLCIKIPSSWEGLQACRTLQSSGVATLATTLFTIEQATLAGEVGCTYIAPYINELKSQFDPTFKDTNKGLEFSFNAQKYYEKHGLKTQVLPACLTSIEEIMLLAGVNHITIGPLFLRELIGTPASSLVTKSLFDGEQKVEVGKKISWGEDEKKWRLAFTLSGKGEGERKLGQAINIFCGAQKDLEKLMEG